MRRPDPEALAEMAAAVRRAMAAYAQEKTMRQPIPNEREKIAALQRAVDDFATAPFGRLNETREALMEAARTLGWQIVVDGDSWPWAKNYLARHR